MLTKLAHWPISLAVASGGARCMIGDEITQRVVEKRSEPNRWRTLTFAAFGFFWCGLAQYGTYSKLLPACKNFIRSRGLWNATWRTEIVLENVLHNPFLYYPCFYATQSIVQGQFSLTNVYIGFQFQN